jgi:membrane-associated phospholipid phosphatase
MPRALGRLTPWLLIAARAQFAFAQSSLGPERRDIGDLRDDVGAVLTAPAHPDRRAIVPTSAVALAFTFTAFRDSAIYAWMTAHPNTLVMRTLAPVRENWRLPLYEGGSGQYLLPLSGALYLAGRVSHHAGLRDAGLGCAAAHLSSAALRDVIYFVVARTRPHTSPTAGRVSFPGTRDWERHSFLSGHIANSMACASFFAHRYSLGVAEPAMYGYVSMIGLGRVADGWHWMSDAVAGAAMGFAIGKDIADRQFGRMAARAPVQPNRLGAAALIPLWSFSF